MLPIHNAGRVAYTIQTVMKSAKFLHAYSHTFVRTATTESFYMHTATTESFYMHTATHLCVPPLQNPCLSQTENLKMKIYTSTLLSNLCGQGTWFITLTEEQGLEAIKDINIAVNIMYNTTVLCYLHYTPYGTKKIRLGCLRQGCWGQHL